jgi:hypothetical protein
VDSDRPTDYSNPSAGEEFFYYKFFTRAGWNSRVCVLNASGTEPEILEAHFFLEVPAALPIEITNAMTTDGQTKEFRGKAVSLVRSYLHHNERDARSFEVPVLKKGTVLVIEERAFSFGLAFPVDSAIDHRLGNESDFYPGTELIDANVLTFARFSQECSIWYGLVLGNEELLPYEWSHTDGRFVPGFFSDATTVRW